MTRTTGGMVGEMNDFDKLADEVLVWHRATFPDVDLLAMARKLMGESLELLEECDSFGMEPRGDHLREELADCLLVLIALAGRLPEYVPNDADARSAHLLRDAATKFDVNKRRRWLPTGERMADG